MTTIPSFTASPFAFETGRISSQTKVESIEKGTAVPTVAAGVTSATLEHKGELALRSSQNEARVHEALSSSRSSEEGRQRTMYDALFADTMVGHKRATQVTVLLTGADATPLQYTQYLALWGMLLERLEGELDAHAIDYDDENTRETYDFFKTTFLSEQIADVVAYMRKEHGVKDVWAGLEEATRLLDEYLEKMTSVGDGEPKRLFWYAWENLLAGVFGGMRMQPRIAEKFGPQAAAVWQYPKLVDDEGGPLIHSDTPVGELRKKIGAHLEEKFKPHFNGIDWSEQDFADAVEMMEIAFQEYSNIFEAIPRE